MCLGNNVNSRKEDVLKTNNGKTTDMLIDQDELQHSRI